VLYNPDGPQTVVFQTQIDWEVEEVRRNGAWKQQPFRWVSWDSAVGIVMGYGLDSLGLIPGGGKRFFSAPQHPDWLWSPPSLLSTGHQGVRRLGHEVDHISI
jgi:hypothetical protein